MKHTLSVFFALLIGLGVSIVTFTGCTDDYSYGETILRGEYPEAVIYNSYTVVNLPKEQYIVVTTGHVYSVRYPANLGRVAWMRNKDFYVIEIVPTLVGKR